MSTEGSLAWRQQRNAEQDADRQRQVSFIDSALANPNISQQDRQTLIHRRLTMMTPQESTAFINRIGALIHGQKKGQPAQGQQAAPSSPAAPPAPPAPPAAKPAAPKTAVDGISIPEMPAPGAPGAPTHPFKSSPVLAHIEQGLKGLESRLKGFAHPVAQDNSWRAAAERNYTTPQELERRKAEMSNKAKLEQIEAAAKAKAQFGTGVARHLADITPADAIKNMHITGETYVGPDGEEITEAQLSEMPQSTKLVGISQGQTTYWIPANQTSKTVNVGGRIVQIPALGQIIGNTEDLGAATSTLPKARTTSHQVLGPTGVVTLHGSGTTRTAPGHGINQPPAPPQEVPPENPQNIPAPPAGEPKNPVLKARPAAAHSPVEQAAKPIRTASQNQAAIDQNLNRKRSLSRRIPAVHAAQAPSAPKSSAGNFKSWPSPLSSMVRAPGQARLAQQTAQTLTQVQGQITGRTAHDKPLWEYSTMYDNPEIRNAMQTALRLTASSGAKTPGGFFSGVLNLGMSIVDTHALNSALNVLRERGGQQALEALGRLQEYRNSLVAVRTLSKAPATQATVSSVLQEGPFMASNSRDFRSRLGNNINTLTQGAISTVGINPDYIKKLDALDEYIQTWQPGAHSPSHPVSSKAPASPGSQKKLTAADLEKALQ